jgi:CheY-like chemotaxis protein
VGETKPDLVLLDLMMPELDGFEVLDQLRMNPEYAALPVIVVTAKDLSQDERQWLLSRSQACIQKGLLSTKEFLDYIQMIVRKESRYAHRT